MILQALHDYYDRSGELAPPGWEYKRIPLLIEITEEGRFVQLTSLRLGPKASEVAPSLVPKSEGRSGTKAYEKPNLLWDHIGFVLGHPKSDGAADVAMAEKQHQHFRQRLNEFAARLPESRGMKAVQRFYESDEAQRVKADPAWAEACDIPGCNVTFRFAADTDLLVHASDVRALIDQDAGKVAIGSPAICLVTGDNVPIVRLHMDISGVGKQPSRLAAINDDSVPAFASYGKHQGENFPVGEVAAFKYATSLNHLLRPGSKQKIRVGDSIAVYWSQREDRDLGDDWFGAIFGDDDPDAHVRQVEAVLSAVHTGAFSGVRGDNKFFVLGLYPPNKARIAVRFWFQAPIREFASQIGRWFDDLEVCRSDKDREHPGLYYLLSKLSLATREKPHGDTSKLPPRLAGDVLRSILSGSPLPPLLLQSVLQRIRAEQSKKDEATGKPVRHVSAARAALLRAYVNRYRRLYSPTLNKEISVSLDKSNSEPPYLLGRLFAAYERVQELASERDLNRTIRDAYFGAAMASPRSVFNRLARLDQIHLRDLKRANPRTCAYLDRLLLEIADKMNSDSKIAFPARSTQDQQAGFALGYYHQRQAFFTKPSDAAGAATEPTV